MPGKMGEYEIVLHTDCQVGELEWSMLGVCRVSVVHVSFVVLNCLIAPQLIIFRFFLNISCTECTNFVIMSGGMTRYDFTKAACFRSQ